MHLTFYFVNDCYDNGHCESREFYKTADEAVSAAKTDWSNLSSYDRLDHKISACLCSAPAEQFSKIMEKEDWESIEDAIDSVGYKCLYEISINGEFYEN